MGFGSIGMTELLVIFTIVLLLFGGKKLPELAHGIGKGLREFKKASRDVQNEFANFERDIETSTREPYRPPTPPTPAPPKKQPTAQNMEEDPEQDG